MVKTLKVFWTALVGLAVFWATVISASEFPKLSCEAIIETLEQPIPTPIHFESVYPILERATFALTSACPLTPNNQPVQILQELVDPLIGYLGALELGAAYEFGMRTEVDVAAARRWYLRYIFMNFDAADTHWDTTRERIAELAQVLPHPELSDAGSSLFETELARIQTLRRGSLDVLVMTIDQFSALDNTKDHDLFLARNILRDIASDGHPEAMHALALRILEHRHAPSRLSRQSQLIYAETYLARAASKGYLPSILELAAYCGANGSRHGMYAAIAMYRLALQLDESGDAPQRLKRLIMQLDNVDERAVGDIQTRVRKGRIPVCGG